MILLFLLLLFFLLLLLISPVAAAEKISVSTTGFAYQNDKASRLGLEKAQRIRYTLDGQYEPKTLKIIPIARKTLPLC